MAVVNPYLLFSGNCEEAFNHYKSIFGGDFGYIGRFKDMPPQEENQVTDEYKDRIMHISLPLSNGSILMGSDSGAATAIITKGNNVTLSINTSSKEEADKCFNGLTAGGAVHMPMNQTFWGDYFGMCEDKFGVNWMISFNEKANEG